jgi:hypothetical protein
MCTRVLLRYVSDNNPPRSQVISYLDSLLYLVGMKRIVVAEY